MYMGGDLDIWHTPFYTLALHFPGSGRAAHHRIISVSARRAFDGHSTGIRRAHPGPPGRSRVDTGGRRAEGRGAVKLNGAAGPQVPAILLVATVLAAGADSGTCADEVTFSGADTGDGGPEAGASVPADSGGLIGARPLTREPLALEKAAPAPDQGQDRGKNVGSDASAFEAILDHLPSELRSTKLRCERRRGPTLPDPKRQGQTGGEFAAPEVVRKRKVVEAKQPELVEGRMEGCRGLLDLPSPVSVADGTFPR
ncbi:hypothetical protein B2J93_6903 [Marssonina coronariae]|uniref:Uncharacterized protein n=1 Tax=Diplocarpon coronariae TaxID=2795749 RepID=A0A218YVL1_9HELO|nr:hypothetical protein B2J93_6903 [Marssonina coronariae]